MALLVMALAYYWFVWAPQGQAPVAQPPPAVDATACSARLSAAQEFAAQHRSCRSSDDCFPVTVAQLDPVTGCKTVFDELVNIDEAEALEGKVNGFFAGGCGERVVYCPLERAEAPTIRCVAQQCAWAK